MNRKIQIKRLSYKLADLSDLDTLRYWDTLPHVIAASDDDWGWEITLLERPIWREQWMVLLDEDPLGFIQIIDPAEEKTHYWGAIGPNYRAIDIWIGPPEFLGQGYGTQMMRWALDRCFADPNVHTVLIDPLATNVKAQRFYKKIGFLFFENRIFDGDDCCVFQLTRNQYNNP